MSKNTNFVSDEEFQKYLEERYEKQRQWYSEKASWNKNRMEQIQFVVIVTSAITPIMISLNYDSLRI